jgi:hypothetical protein
MAITYEHPFARYGLNSSLITNTIRNNSLTTNKISENIGVLTGIALCSSTFARSAVFVQSPGQLAKDSLATNLFHQTFVDNEENIPNFLTIAAWISRGSSHTPP